MSPLPELPRIDRLRLAEIVLPDTHPQARRGPTAEVFAFVVHHPGGTVLVDSGIGSDNEFINQAYAPTVVNLRTALNAAGIDERDVTAVVNSHLHFDHCGQNPAFYGGDVPFYVQAAELEAAREPFYTDPDWAAIPEHQVRPLDGDLLIDDGMWVLATPGHTPGHQSLVVQGGGAAAIVAGQCVWSLEEFRDCDPDAVEMHEDLADRGRESVARLLGFDPEVTFFSHDPRAYVLPSS